jgi:hypothetical protein
MTVGTQEDRMKRNEVGVIAFLLLALTLVCPASGQSPAKDKKNPYPSMAPAAQYLMDRDAEIALARSAAPESISRDAKVLVLSPHGYETAAEGKNGFVCLVERAWMAPFDDPEFWNPKNRGPLCMNPQAVHLALPIDYKRAAMALAGKSKEQIKQWTEAAYASKHLPGFEPGAMGYMLSKAAYLTDRGGHNVAHLMFYTPLIKGADWGADLPNSPVLLIQKGPPEPFNIFIVPVGQWSDGTPAS